MMRKYIVIIILLVSILPACNDMLEEEVFSQLGPSNFFSKAEDAEALLNAAYATSQGGPDRLVNYLLFGEIPTDIMLERRGAINRHFKPIEDFTWDATHRRLTNEWNNQFRVIYRANTILDKVPAIKMDEERKKEILAEARFLRAFSYFYLYDLFGPTPLIKSSESSVDDRPARASEKNFIAFVEGEFLAASEDLPPAPKQTGRASKGAALGFLTKFYLNNHKWAEAAEAAQKVMDLNEFSIFDPGNRTELFALENEGNTEMIYVRPYIPQPGYGNSYLSHATPPKYKFQYGQKINFAAQFKIRSEFIDLFESQDERREAFLFEYTNTSGENVVLGQDNARSFKYPEDPNSINQFAGNDVPLLRYADILLSRAEALNELQGPNQEAVFLINEVRGPAGINSVDVSDFSDREALRAFILDERGREFHTEALRRQDLIRHGKFVEMAVSRGKQAFDYHVRYPIPLSEIDKNANLEQNKGYIETM